MGSKSQKNHFQFPEEEKKKQKKTLQNNRTSTQTKNRLLLLVFMISELFLKTTSVYTQKHEYYLYMYEFAHAIEHRHLFTCWLCDITKTFLTFMWLIFHIRTVWMGEHMHHMQNIYRVSNFLIPEKWWDGPFKILKSIAIVICSSKIAILTLSMLCNSGYYRGASGHPGRG